MLENIAALAFASLLSVGTYATSFVVSPAKAEIISPLPSTTPSPTPTSTPTPTPTATPTPTPTATPTPTPQPIVTSDDLERMFNQYSGQYSVDKELMKRIANCESGFNTNASYLDYGGMFQFSPSSWASTRMAMGQDPNADLRYNAEEAIKTAAFKISQPNGPNAWPNCH